LKLCSHKIYKARKRLTSAARKLTAVNSRNVLPMYRATKLWFSKVDRQVRAGLNRMAVSFKKADAHTIVLDLADWDKLNEEGKKIFLPHQIRVYAQAMGTAAELAKFKLPFNLPNKRAIAWSKKHITPFMKDLTDQTRLGIQQLVTDSLERGLGSRATAREIRRLKNFTMNPRQARALGNYRAKLTGVQDRIAAALRANDGNMAATARSLRIKVPKAWIKQIKMGTFDIDRRVAKEAAKKVRYRAEIIARTEVARATSEGTLEGYKEAGVEKVRFEAALDSCEVCANYDGNTYTRQESEGMIPAHVSCRCVWTPVIEPPGV